MSDVGEDALVNKGKEESCSVKNGEEAISSNGMPIDRLSAMPDEILINILSRLGSDVKDAAVTCVLSKRWNFLWTEMPRLNFCDYSQDPERTPDFVSRVHRIIILHSSSYIDQFSVDFSYSDCYALDVKAWIRFALKNKVKDLSVQLYSRSYFTPPLLLYSDASLTRMSLLMCNLAPPGKIDWPHLSYLTVKDVELPQEVVEKILSGSPVLYFLCLRSCWGFNNINSESLRELKLSDRNYGNNVDLLEISAPRLSSLDISFSPIGKKVQLTNLPSSLDCAKFFYYEMDDSVELMNNTMELLEKTRHAKLLVLGGSIIEVLSEMVMRGWKLPQSSRVQLTLTLTLTLETSSESIIPGILCLLESSPNLKKLLIECIDCYEGSEVLWGPSPKNDLDYDLLNLKTVGLLHFAETTNFECEPMLTMARILLKRATMLEKMVIELENEFGGSPDLTKLSEIVLGYPRSSEKAVIVFQKSGDEDP